MELKFNFITFLENYSSYKKSVHTVSLMQKPTTFIWNTLRYGKYLTIRWNKVILEKLTVIQLVKKVPAF
jgi:hypothetical protein